ncbi:NifB/NifX family molybdenum-iron cluster-binding protein [uncultured Desulfosarcina sp.]|uniref:NifB/NifX family molybdenum-iron cluster-binding protein n=1 Tax=uncultured Desulfosarcina sp. TaxID=218289 RepID=UPI0029C912A2|nr:NifB/NifX family molybdenum-iron cluster-binding protein [uncultured Desulfosarcina sp.]
MIRIAIPIFRNKVSPVFDSCTRVFLVDIEEKREIDRKEIYLDALALTERVTILLKSGVDTIICGGISDVMESMLMGAKINLISDITGEIDQVLKAYLEKGLGQMQFQIPGFSPDSHKKGTNARERDHENH